MGKRKYTYQEVYDIFFNEGYILLSKEYVNNKQQLDYTCPNGHTHHVTLANFKTGYRCPHCYGNVKYTYEQVKNIVEEKGYSLLSTEYVNNKTPLEVKCFKEHIFYPTLDNFQKGTGCPHRAKKYKGEEKVANILNDLGIVYKRQYKFEECKNERKLPFDFYLPTYNICIEYNGEYHYEPVDYSGKGKEWAENKFKHTQKIDNIKRNYCKDNNIKLIEIPYWDFNNIEETLKKELNI